MNVHFYINKKIELNHKVILNLYQRLYEYYSKHYNLIIIEKKILITKQNKILLGFGENNRHLLRVLDKIEINTNKNKSGILVKFNVTKLIYFSIIVVSISNFFGIIYGYKSLTSFLILNVKLLVMLYIFGSISILRHISIIKESLNK